MTTFTTEDREHAFGATINVEPIPFAGMVQLTDEDNKEQMLRDQIRMQQNEIGRLRSILMNNGIPV